MLLTAALVSALALAGPDQHPAPMHRPTMGVTARAPQHHGRMYSISRSMGFQFTTNGRSWASRPMIGPDAPPARRSCEVPGPGAYGAPVWDQQRVPVVVGSQLIFISPWQRIEMPGLHWLERERIQWLKAHNYCSGVRTFRNDAYHALQHDGPRHDGAMPPPPPPPPGDQGGMLDEDVVTMRGPVAPARIEPRATIRLPDDAPRFRSKMRVMAPSIHAYQGTYRVACEQPGVTTFRGEWSDGSVIKVLPIAHTTATQAAVATADTKSDAAKQANAKIERNAQSKPNVKQEVKVVVKPALKVERVANADK